jgi:hypothetical protein
MTTPQPLDPNSSPPPGASAEIPPSPDSIWQYGRTASSEGGHGTFMSMAGLAVVLFLLPFYGLALLVITVTEAIKGLPLSYAATFKAPMFWVPWVGTGLLCALLLGVARAMAGVIRFSFDLDRQVLRYTETRMFGKPIDVEIGFDAIASVRPYKLSGFARTGHLGVTLPRKRGLYVTKTMGMGDAIPVAELEALSARLRPYLGERAHELLDLDK